jgi:hypothetical protein
MGKKTKRDEPKVNLAWCFSSHLKQVYPFFLASNQLDSLHVGIFDNLVVLEKLDLCKLLFSNKALTNESTEASNYADFMVQKKFRKCRCFDFLLNFFLDFAQK